MNKHTPGPWHVGRINKCTIYDKLSQRLANSFEGVMATQFTDSQCEANARLIAAAPELLEACKTFAEWLRREEAGSEGQSWSGKRGTLEGEAGWREWWNENLRICGLAQEQALAAIAKATGE